MFNNLLVKLMAKNDKVISIKGIKMSVKKILRENHNKMIEIWNKFPTNLQIRSICI